MHRRTLLRAAGAATLAPHVARAQAFPQRPVTLYCAFPAGGAH